MDHSILCPAFVGPLDRISGAGPSGPCECDAEPPPPLPVHENLAPEPVGETPEADVAATTSAIQAPAATEPKPAETACADSRPLTDVKPTAGSQAELPFDPEPLVDPKTEATKECDHGNVAHSCGLCAAGDKPTQAAAPAPPVAPAAVVPPPATPAPPPSADAPVEVPKRKRRTKTEIEAAKAAAKTPPSGAAPPAAAPTPAGDARLWTFGEFMKELTEISQSSGRTPRLEVSEKLDTLVKRAEASFKSMAQELVGRVKGDIEKTAPPTVQAVSTEEETKLRVAIASHEAVIRKLIQERDTYKETSSNWKQCFESSERDRKNGVPLMVDRPVPPGPKKRIFAGIDPGISGYESAVDENMNIVFTTACPTIMGKTRAIHDTQGIVDEVRRWKALGVDTVLMEAQQAFPKIGSIANFVKGVSKGVWEAALLAHGVRFDTIRPIDWKKAMGIAGGDPKDVKRRAIAKCQRLFPGTDLRADPENPRKKKLSSDKAESLLLAVYVARMALGAAPGTEQWGKLEGADAAMVASAPALSKQKAKDVEDADEDVDVPDEAKTAALRELGDRVRKGMRKGLAKITKLPIDEPVPGPKKNEKDQLRAALKRAASKGKKS